MVQLGPLELPPPVSKLTGISGCSLAMGEAVVMVVKESIAAEDVRAKMQMSSVARLSEPSDTDAL